MKYSICWNAYKNEYLNFMEFDSRKCYLQEISFVKELFYKGLRRRREKGVQ